MRASCGIALAVLLLAGIQGGCGTPTRVGEVCQTNDHCGKEGDFQLTCDLSVPGGTCALVGCTPDDPTTTGVAEDEDSCPEGSRCVKEGTNVNICRRSCSIPTDCREAVYCAQECADQGNSCKTKCKNHMQCLPFWQMATVPEDAPRACIFKLSLD